MKTVINSTVRILAIVLVIVGMYLAIMGSVKPTSEAHAVTVTGNGPHSESTKGAHFSQSGNWMQSYTVVNRLSEFPVMCFDPLLTNTVILSVEGCGTGQAAEEKRAESRTESPVTTVPPVVDVRPQEPNQEFPYEPPVVIPQEPDTTEPPVIVPDEPKQDKPKHCNKGEGNGGEGCDPGNHPENGNDDENETSPREDNSHKPEKEDKKSK